MTILSNILNAAVLAGSWPLAAAAPVSSSSSCSGMVSSTYFAGFHADKNPAFTVSQIPWSKYTDVKYAFAETTRDNGLNLSASTPENIAEFVAAGKKHGVKTILSVGGWTGSLFMSNYFTPENRTASIQTIIDMVKKHGFDGFDIDWEYPNRLGLSCNVIHKEDTANLLEFFKEVRAHPDGKDLYLTAAGSLFPWYGPDGKSSTDLGGFADVLDYIMLMNYDVYGAWATTGGPNAPLEQSCDKRNTMGGGKEGVQKWEAAGIPANKLVLGLAAYGHGFAVNKTSAFTAPGVLNMYPPQNSSDRRQGSSWDTDPPVDPCGDPQPHSGTFPFWSMIEEAHFLNTDGKPAEGIAYGYDDCSQTPAVYDEKNQWWVSYDNAQSIKVKTEYVKSAGLKGFLMYEAGGDYKNILIDAARTGAGIDK